MSEQHQNGRSRVNRRWLMALPALLLALFGVYQGATSFSQDLAFNRVRTEMSFWGRGNYQPEPGTIARAGQAIKNLVDDSADNPEFLTLHANYFAWQSYWSEDKDARAAYARRAVQSQLNALQNRPAHRQSWSIMVKYAAGSAGAERLHQKAQSRLQALRVTATPGLAVPPI